MLSVNRNPSLSELRSFAIVMLCACVGLGMILWYSAIKPEGAWWPESGIGFVGSGRQIAAVIVGGIGVAVASACAMSYRAGRALYVAWMSLAMVLGTCMTTILLSAVFVAILPVFTLIRLKDPLRLRLKNSGSYWENYEPHEATIERTMRPF
jgi:hypothetical protein